LVLRTRFRGDHEAFCPHGPGMELQNRVPGKFWVHSPELRVKVAAQFIEGMMYPQR
jgi:hypothetical protein